MTVHAAASVRAFDVPSSFAKQGVLGAPGAQGRNVSRSRQLVFLCMLTVCSCTGSCGGRDVPERPLNTG